MFGLKAAGQAQPWVRVRAERDHRGKGASDRTRSPTFISCDLGRAHSRENRMQTKKRKQALLSGGLGGLGRG